MSFDRVAAALTRKAERLAEARGAMRRRRGWYRPDLLWPLFTTRIR